MRQHISCLTSPHSKHSPPPKPVIVTGEQADADFGCDTCQRKAPRAFAPSSVGTAPAPVLLELPAASHTISWQRSHFSRQHLASPDTHEPLCDTHKDDSRYGKTITVKYPSTLNFASGMVIRVLNF